MNLRFSETESVFDYMAATREYLEQHGKPTASYSDRHAVQVSVPDHVEKC